MRSLEIHVLEILVADVSHEFVELLQAPLFYLRVSLSILKSMDESAESILNELLVLA
jgi:hypothetical protein